MSQARVAAFGGAATFLLAAVVGVLGNQLTEDAVWSWVFFVTALTIGALATSWFAFHGATNVSFGNGPATDSESLMT